MSDDVLVQLAATISARRSAAPDSSYTRQLLEAGPVRCAKKFGEEAIETVIAGAGESDEQLKAEAADSSIICWCCSRAAASPLTTCLAVLEQAPGRLGLKEKAERAQALI